VAEDSVVSEVVTKERLYQAYIRFCKKHNLAILSKENLGKILKAGKKLEEGRESSGKKRGTIWKGIKLTSEYDIDARQETLDVSNDNHEPNISCYYCSYQTNTKEDYERHVLLKHPKKLAYPGKADMESLGLSPKGNTWEVVGA
jgi:hypothetical protein